MNKNDQEWVCIDDIHAFYKRKISDKVYEFKKRSKITKVIDLNKYTYEQQEEALQTMCWDFAFLQELRHSEESINEIVAELLYEKESEFDNTDVTLTIPVEHAEEVIHLIRY